MALINKMIYKYLRISVLNLDHVSVLHTRFFFILYIQQGVDFTGTKADILW